MCRDAHKGTGGGYDHGAPGARGAAASCALGQQVEAVRLGGTLGCRYREREREQEIERERGGAEPQRDGQGESGR